MERLAFTALVISGGIRRLMKWGELTTPPPSPHPPSTCQGALVSYIEEAVFIRLPVTFWVKLRNFDNDVAAEILFYTYYFSGTDNMKVSPSVFPQWPIRPHHSEYHPVLYPRILGNAPKRLSVRLDSIFAVLSLMTCQEEQRTHNKLMSGVEALVQSYSHNAAIFRIL